MPLRLATNALRSRSVRQIVTNGESVRSIRSGEDPVGLWGRITSFIGQLWNKLTSYGGWLTDQLRSGLSFSFTEAWGWITQTVSNIYNFNWQQSDEDLDKRITTLRNGLISRFGGALGQMAGWISCGIVPTVGVMTFNSMLGAYLLKEVGEEALDELSGELVGILKASFSVFAQETMITAFKNTRKAIKKWNEGLTKNSWEREALDKFFDNRSDDLIATWGDKDRKPWSFRIWVEKEIESIESDLLQDFVEEFYEEFLDSCVEAGYVIAQGLDSWILQQQMTADAVRGQDRVIEIVPDREAEDNQSGETLTLAGGENEIRAQLPQTMANYQLVENRDIGQWVGETIRDSTRANPSELTVRLILYSRKSPPYSQSQQRATITLHDFKKDKLNWQTIKDAINGILIASGSSAGSTSGSSAGSTSGSGAGSTSGSGAGSTSGSGAGSTSGSGAGSTSGSSAGSTKGYTYGRFRATAKLTSGRQLVVYAASENEAENKVYDFEQLIEPDIQALNITEEKKTGARANGKPLQKQPIQIYPAYMYIESKQRILNQGTDPQGFQTLDGTYNTRRFTIELFPDEKPADFERVVAQALATPGVN